MSQKKQTRQHLIYALILFILVSSLVGAGYYYITSLQEDYTIQIHQTKQDLTEQLTNVQKELDQDISNLQSQVSQLEDDTLSNFNTVNQNIQDFKDQSEKELTTLNKLIETVEEQNNVQLSELKSNIKDIQIKSADFSAIIDDVLPSVVSVSSGSSLGSGVVFKNGGYIVTNYHVIDNNPNGVVIRTYGGDVYQTQYIGSNTQADISVLKIESDLPELDFANDNDIQISNKVIALGSPAGLEFTVTEGIISAKRTFSGIEYIQTDVSINPGNSGGPLIDQEGNIVGINNFKAAGDFEGLGFAIAASEVEDIVNDIIDEYEAAQQAS